MQIKPERVRQVASHRNISSVVVASILCWLTAGCANLTSEAQHSDGLFDFAAALAGHPRMDVVPVERFSGRGGEIVSAHAEADQRGGTYVSGTVHSGFGYSGIYNAHIDVRVFGTDRRLIAALTTNYFPRPIPSNYHGIIGRAWFGVRLPFVPTDGSTIQVSYQQTAFGEHECAQSNPGE